MNAAAAAAVETGVHNPACWPRLKMLVPIPSMLLMPFLYNKYNPTRVHAFVETGELTSEKFRSVQGTFHAYKCMRLQAK